MLPWPCPAFPSLARLSGICFVCSVLVFLPPIIPLLSLYTPILVFPSFRMCLPPPAVPCSCNTFSVCICLFGRFVPCLFVIFSGGVLLVLILSVTCLPVLLFSYLFCLYSKINSVINIILSQHIWVQSRYLLSTNLTSINVKCGLIPGGGGNHKLLSSNKSNIYNICTTDLKLAPPLPAS